MQVAVAVRVTAQVGVQAVRVVAVRVQILLLLDQAQPILGEVGAELLAEQQAQAALASSSFHTQAHNEALAVQ